MKHHLHLKEASVLVSNFSLEKNKKEFNEKIADAESKLNDARAKIAEIENPKWYVLDRKGNAGYSSFIQDTDSIANIGKVFPVIFFIVAALISLTSMTRMVEEQRSLIGTYKALGYGKGTIVFKFVAYAFIASFAGSVIGCIVGLKLFPYIIYNSWNIIYQMPHITYASHTLLSVACLLYTSDAADD